MALPTVCNLLLIFSILPLFADAWTRCSSRSGYCPAGSDCNRNISLCEDRSQNATKAEERREECNKAVTLSFTQSAFIVSEGNGPATAVLTVSEALECCSFSVMVQIEHLTTDNNDYDYPSSGYERVIFSAGQSTAEMSLLVTDDDLIEPDELFRVTIVEVSLPYGIALGQPEQATVIIQDNDRGEVSLQRTAYTISERAGAVRIYLRVNKAAAFDYSVIIGTTDTSANECDYDNGPHIATFEAGQRLTSFLINITDDDMHEGSEGFNIFIIGFSSNAIYSGSPSRGSVTITDDETTIRVSFCRSSYTVSEDVGSLSPELKLSRPSPCCITVYVELIQLPPSPTAATGNGEDYGHSPPINYEYVFPAGEMNAVPVNPIPIIDDRVSERDERFMMRIMQLSLPLGFTASTSPVSVTIKDNDIEFCFCASSYSINENGGELKVRFCLDKPATEDFLVTIYDYGINATSEDYGHGPYNLTVTRNSRFAELCIPVYPDVDQTYTGNKVFTLFFDGDSLPPGLVPCNTTTATVILLDNEFTVCFGSQKVSVEEGQRARIMLATSRRVSPSVRVRLICTDGTAYSSGSRRDYFQPSVVFVSTESTLFISTVNENTCERNETFTCFIPPELIQPNASNCNTAVEVTIVNNDCCTVEFERTFYRLTDKNVVGKPKLKLSNPIAYSILVSLRPINKTAIEKEDYEIQEKRPITFTPYSVTEEFSIDAIDDDVVETLTEEFCVEIAHVATRDGGAKDCVTIGEDKKATFQIRDDDTSEVDIVDGLRLELSKTLYSNATIKVQYKTGTPTEVNFPARTKSYTLKRPVDEIAVIDFCIPEDLRNRVRLSEDLRNRVRRTHPKVNIC